MKDQPQEKTQVSEQSFSGKVIRNTLFNTFGNIWSMGIRVVLVPYIWSFLGNDRYGVWGLVGILNGYFGLFDFGLARSFDKYLSEYYTKREYDNFNKVVSIGLVFYLIFSVFIIVVILISYKYIMSFWGLTSDRLSQEVLQESTFAIIGSIIIFGWGMTTSVFGMVMIGLQRMDIINKIGISISVLNVIGTILALELGYGLRGLIINNGAVAIIGSGITLLAAYRLFPNLRVNLFTADWRMFRRMFSFGTKLQVAKLANLLTFLLDRQLISRFFHVGLIPPYQFSANFISSVRNVLLMIPSAVIPATSELEARNDSKRSLEFYERGTRYLILFGTPVCMFSAIAASLIMWGWIGRMNENVEQAITIIQIVALGYYANLSTGVATGVAVGMGKPEYEMKFGILLAILSVVLSLGLITTVGFYGPAIATTISLTVCALYFYRIFHNYLGQPLGAFLYRLYTIPILTSVFVGVVVSGLQYLLIQAFDPYTRLESLSLLCFEGLIFVGLYIFIILKTSYLDPYDRSLFHRYLIKLRMSKSAPQPHTS